MERVVDCPARTRTVEHDSAQGAFRLTLRSPEPALGREVMRLNAYRERGTGPLLRRELPSGLATLVFNLGADLGVAFPGEARHAFGDGGAFFTGPGARHAITDIVRDQDGAQVMLTALGARRLSGMPLAEIGDALIDPVAMFGGEARALIGRLQEAAGHAARLDLIEAFLRKRLSEAAPVADDLGHALERLTATRGRVGVAALAEEIGCSRKHLSQRFHREFGMPPKLFARTLRFARAVRALETGRIESWAGLAAACGYADQAHLSRDFSAFAGAPPAAFAARRLPDGVGFLA